MTQEKKKRTKSEWLHSNQRITCYFLRFLSLLCPWRGVGRSLSTNLNEVRHKFHLNLFRSSPSFPSALPSRSPLSFPFTCNLHTCPCNLYPCLQIARAQTLVYFVYFPISWSSPFCVSAYPSPSILLFYSILFPFTKLSFHFYLFFFLFYFCARVCIPVISVSPNRRRHSEKKN